MTVKLIVPWPPGGATDYFARVLAQHLHERMGQNFIVENKPGAGGAIGAVLALRAAPDGYTLMVTNRSFTSTPVATKVAYDPLRDAEPVGNLVTSYFIFASSNKSGIKTLADLVTQARAHPDTLSYGSIGIGSTLHLMTEGFLLDQGLKLIHVPYGGTAPAVNALAGGQIDILFTDPGLVLPLAVNGQVHAMAVAGERRLDGIPAVPTATQAGFPGLAQTGSWQAVFAPKGTPAAIVDALNREIRAIMSSPEVLAQLPPRSMTLATGSPADLGAMVRSDVELWRRVALKAGITPQ